MKHAKTVGLVVVGAAILLLLVGVGAASATVLCENNESASTCNKPYGAGTEIALSLASGTKAKLKAEFKTIECSKSALAGKTESAGSETETVKGAVEALTFEECNCEAKVLTKGTFEVHWISGSSNGTVTQNGAEVTVNCSTIFGTVHCIYKTENTDLGTLTGGSPAKLDVNASLPNLTTSFLCSEATWEASYEFTKPNPLYVTEAAAPTKLCAEAAFECSEGQTYPEGTRFRGTTAIGELMLHFAATNWFIECKNYILIGQTATREGDPLATSGVSLFETCELKTPGKGKCSIAVQLGNGRLEALGDWKNGRWQFGPSALVIACGEQPGLNYCVYEENSPAVTVIGGQAGTAEPGKIEVNRKFTPAKGNNAGCPSSVTWNVTYIIGKPEEEGVGTVFVTN